MDRIRLLITGGGGYIAQSLLRGLDSKKYHITLVCRTDFDLTNYDAVCGFFKNNYFDVVIHTAIVGGNRLKSEDADVLKQNLAMYYNLMFNKDRFGKFISFGSGAEFIYPTTPYGMSKRIIADLMAAEPHCLNLRLFAVFDENEDDRRFIKANVNRYINKEDLVIHEDKVMDFFYMPDLISLVDYMLQREHWIFNEIDCKYVESKSLLEIAQMINKLSTYRVGIDVQNTDGKPYVGHYTGLPIPLLGLERGIADVYRIIKSNI